MKITRLLALMEKLMYENADASMDAGAAEILQTKDTEYADVAVTLVADFLSKYPKYSNVPTKKFINELFHIRPKRPIPTVQKEMGTTDAFTGVLQGAELDKTAQTELTEPVMAFMYEQIKKFVGGSFDDVPTQYAQRLSRIRQFLELVSDATLGEVSQGDVDGLMRGRFAGLQKTYSEHRVNLRGLSYKALLYLHVLLKTSSDVEGGKKLDMEKFRSAISKMGGSTDTADEVIGSYREAGILSPEGLISKGSLTELRTAMADTSDAIDKHILNRNVARLDDANARDSLYAALAKVANTLPRGLLQRAVPIVNNELSAVGFDEINSLYQDASFYNTPAGALYKVIVVQQAARHLRKILAAVAQNRRPPPMKGWIEKKVILNRFAPGKVEEMLRPRPKHPLVQRMKSVSLS